MENNFYFKKKQYWRRRSWERHILKRGKKTKRSGIKQELGEKFQA